MAYIKTVSPSIKDTKAVVAVINYVTRSDLVTYYNCCKNNSYAVAQEFETTRKIFNKDNNILAHHLIQSFSINDHITASKAHELAKDFAEKCLSNYQVVFATHTDSKYIHTHFVINSVSPFDGRKFYDNKRTINMLRRASDEICYKNGLTVIETKSNKYSRLDDSTYRLAIKGKSWKFNLVNDLDDALKQCSSKDDFIKFFSDNHYTVKFTNKNITFRKDGETKSIRADTLAKQFGNKYSKTNIFKSLGLEIPKEKLENNKRVNSLPNIDDFNQQAKAEWKRYEKKYQNRIKINNPNFFSAHIFSRDPYRFAVNLILYIFRRQKYKSVHKSITKTHYRIKEFTDYKNLNKTIGNISYKQLIQTVGNTTQIKLYTWQLSKLFDNGILCSAKINLQSGTAIVTLKEHNLDDVAKILGLSNSDEFIQQADTIKNRKIYHKLKKNNKKLEYLMVNKTQLSELEQRYVEFAKFKKNENSYNIAFSSENKEKILDILYPNKKVKTNTPAFVQRNAMINRRLKKQSEETGEKLCYKIIVSDQYKALKNSDIDYAVFRQKDGRYNIVFLEHSRMDINKLLSNAKKEDLINRKTQI